MARGALRIYLGAAPGVGKTYAMLDEGWRRAERGTDVVVGYLETHGRPHTEAQLRDLELFPRRTLEYRGQTFTEMDIDAILKRKPAVALVDELAHTNIVGSRNAKRWQDVEELLDAGIDVISTVNVQHLESLNDVVESITGIRQRETIPDSVVRSASQVEIVDMSPEALRRRMAHGNIYKAEKVDAALANYFRVGNLSALRELALLWMADRVDASLHEYREDHGIDGVWETRERVLVALTGAEGSDVLIRRAARMAMRTRGELVGVHVRTSDGLTGLNESALSQHRVILEEVGGRYLEVGGADVSAALLQVAKAENATQIVIGASRQSRLSVALRGSIVNQLIRATNGLVDVHVISTNLDAAQRSSPATALPSPRQLSAVGSKRQTIAFAMTLILFPVLTYVLSLVRDDVGLQNALLIHLLVVVAIASVGGMWPAAVASIVAFALLNWFFTPPLHTLTIANGRDSLALISFLVVAGSVSVSVDLAARRRIAARRSEAEAKTLATMARTVLDDTDPLPRIAEQLTVAFGIDSLSVLVPLDSGGWAIAASAGDNPPATPDGAASQLALPDGAMLVWNGGKLHAEELAVVASFSTQLTLAMNRQSLQRTAVQAAQLAEANEFRNGLLAAVGHDFRTPLASIRAAATTLLSDDVEFDRDTTKELLQMVDDEADRLNSLVGNLLDMSRLQSGVVSLRLQPVGIEEVVASAVGSLHPAPDTLAIDVSETLPRVLIDTALFERAIANVVANALVFAPPATLVRIEAAVVGATMHLRVIDRGRGIPLDAREQVTQPFQRLGDHPNGQGIGLGLAVAKGFIVACGGELRIEDTPGGGCTIVIVVALAS